jgi:penicillin-binding protein 2
MLNRAVSGTYPPGSTFKISQGLTFLQEGIITSSTQYPCVGGFRFGKLKLGCHAHGAPLPLVPSIATSCNSFFCWGLYNMFNNRKNYQSTQEAMTTWKDYMVSMGFGYKLGVDLPGEARGMIPNAEYYTRRLGKSWSALTVISISIGQGEVTLTPLQIANLGATVANRGYYITPHVVKAVEGGNVADSLLVKHFTKVEKKFYDIAVEGMRSAVTGGTCRAANSLQYEVCGKTGTAQNRGQDHSVFMGFAPKENPQIAIAVYVENGGFGAHYGVPIGALMMEQYINGSLSPESEKKAETFQQKQIHYGTRER